MDKKGIILVLMATSCSSVSKLSGKEVIILEEDSLASKKQYECGRNLTLPCKFKKNPYAIVWKNANDIIAISKCVNAKCTLNPKYVGMYTISTDMTRGFFNLTVTKVTKHDNGRKLVCTDGSSSDSHIIRVRDYEPLIIEDPKNGTILAISGCIPESMNVLFKWIKINIRNNGEEEIIPKIQHANTTSCSNDSECGNDHQIQYSEVVLAKASENGHFYLKVVADYGNEVKESHMTVERYTIDDTIDEGEKNNDPNNYSILGTVLFLLVMISVAAVCCLKAKK